MHFICNAFRPSVRPSVMWKLVCVLVLFLLLSNNTIAWVGRSLNSSSYHSIQPSRRRKVFDLTAKPWETLWFKRKERRKENLNWNLKKRERPITERRTKRKKRVSCSFLIAFERTLTLMKINMIVLLFTWKYFWWTWWLVSNWALGRIF